MHGVDGWDLGWVADADAVGTYADDSAVLCVYGCEPWQHLTSRLVIEADEVCEFAKERSWDVTKTPCSCDADYGDVDTCSEKAYKKAVLK